MGRRQQWIRPISKRIFPRQKEPEAETPLDARPTADVQRSGPIWQFLWFLASLRITVILLTLCLFLVFTSTIAQMAASNWQVVTKFYGLHSFLIWIPFQDFANLLNQMFGLSLKVSGSFPFLGGMALGTLLLINLLAAHVVRFQLKVCSVWASDSSCRSDSSSAGRIGNPPHRRRGNHGHR